MLRNAAKDSLLQGMVKGLGNGKRRRLPMLKKVTKRIGFSELFPPDSSRSERIARWRSWKCTVAREPEQIENWQTDPDCFNCGMYSDSSDWCDFSSLPPSVNPYLSFRHGIPGLACAGLYSLERRQEREQFEGIQQELFPMAAGGLP
jgi:hypothetical protein